MEKFVNWTTLIIGVLILLPMLGVDKMGDLTQGPIGWLIPLLVIVIGVKGLMGAGK